MSSQNKKSILYYLLPAFFAIIGGVVALLILRNSDPKKGRNCIILGVIGSAIAIGYDYVAETFDITFGNNIETYGISDYMGGCKYLYFTSNSNCVLHFAQNKTLT